MEGDFDPRDYDTRDRETGARTIRMTSKVTSLLGPRSRRDL